MNGRSRDELFKDIVALLESLREDWEFSGEISPKTSLIKDMELESIDLVALGSAIEEKYQKHQRQTKPRSQFKRMSLQIQTAAPKPFCNRCLNIKTHAVITSVLPKTRINYSQAKMPD